MSLINIRSLRSNSLLLLSYLKYSKIKLVAITETWISPDDSDIFSLFHDIGYSLFISPRIKGRGGGVGILVHSDLPSPTIIYPSFSYSDCLTASLNFMNTVYSFTIIYRPPKQDYTTFYNEFYDYITDTQLSNNNHNFILGDFNYHFESNIHPHSTFKNLTDSLSLHQFITFPTHIAGHTLDLIFCRSHSSCQCITDCCKSDLITDHFLITYRLVLPHSTSIEKKSITYRNYRSLDYDCYALELKLILLSLPCSIDSLNYALSYLIDKFAPLKTRTINIHSNSPWFSSELVSFKRNLRKLERIFHSNPSSSNLLIFSTYRKFYKSEISKAKSAFYISKINNLTSNPRASFALARKLLSPTMPINILHIPNIAKKKNYVMNSLIILLIKCNAPALLFHLSYQLDQFRAYVLVNQSHTIFLNSICLLFSQYLILFLSLPLLNLLTQLT